MRLSFRHALISTVVALATVVILYISVNRQPQEEPSPSPQQQASDRPNIVMIFTDDQRADTLACMGTPWARTPNIDRLAQEGTLFENAFVITSLCCPSRATVLSGQYTHVHGVSDNAMDLNYAESPFLPEYLQRHGYETGFIGKYHLGGLTPSGLPRAGFDHWAGIYGQGQYLFCPMNINGQETKTAAGEYLTDVLAGMAVEWIEQRNARPFFLLLSLKSPHGPLYHAGRYDNLYSDVSFSPPTSFFDPIARLPREVQQFTLPFGAEHGDAAGLGQLQRLYALMIPTIDDAVGAVYNALEEKGILDRTMFIFASDNGHLFGEHRVIGKGLAYDPSMRIPLIIRYPEAFPPGHRSPQQVLNLDLPPTIIESTGAPIPPSMQGKSLFGLIGNGPSAWRKDWIYVGQYPENESAPILAVRDDTWKYIRYRRPFIEEDYFDLRQDPDERQNLAGDPAYRSAMEAARLRMQELMVEAQVPADWWAPMTTPALPTTP